MKGQYKTDMKKRLIGCWLGLKVEFRYLNPTAVGIQADQFLSEEHKDPTTWTDLISAGIVSREDLEITDNYVNMS